MAVNFGGKSGNIIKAAGGAIGIGGAGAAATSGAGIGAAVAAAAPFVAGAAIGVVAVVGIVKGIEWLSKK